MIFKAKYQSHIQMHFSHYMYPKMLVIEHRFCHVQPHNQPWGQNVRVTSR